MGKWLQKMVHSLVTVTYPDSEACAGKFSILAPKGTGIFASHVPVNLSHSISVNSFQLPWSSWEMVILYDSKG